VAQAALVMMMEWKFWRRRRRFLATPEWFDSVNGIGFINFSGKGETDLKE
jgi:hypothetical protein